jgi:ABC-type sugar transport system ATPase subunit
MNEVLVQINYLQKSIGDNKILQHINLAIDTLQNIAFIGESGSGKTSLLKSIAGLLQPTSGEILFENKKVLGPLEQLIAGHKNIQYLSQQYELHNNYFVKDLIWFDNKLTEEEAIYLFETCKIDHLLNRKTDELSGGEKQRIGLCKLLIQKPKLLVLDEPFSNLDFDHKTTLKQVLHSIRENTNTTIFLASHDPQDVLNWADKIVVLKDGLIVQMGTPKDIYYTPKNKYVAALLGQYNYFTNNEFKEILPHYSTSHNIVVRPEHITIVELEQANCVAKILSIEFFGIYSLVLVTINNLAAKFVAQPNEILTIGETICLKIEEENLIGVED